MSEPTGTDIDANPRIVGGIVDMGAFEHPAPVVIRITTETANVPNGVDALDVGGISGWVVGTMTWTNARNAANGRFTAVADWLVTDLPLAYGENRITVSGTNSIGEVASDEVTITRDPYHTGNSPIHYVSTTLNC